MLAAGAGRAALICFRTRVGKAKPAALRELMAQAGLRRVLEGGRPVALEDAQLKPSDGAITVVLDRVTVAADRRAAIVDSLEAALRAGRGDVELRIDAQGSGAPLVLQFSERLRCAGCGLDYADPTPAMFSFNNPVGACESCKGFGRTMDIDPNLVVPDPRLTLAGGCIKIFQTASYKECQDDLLKFCRRAGIAADVALAGPDRRTSARSSGRASRAGAGAGAPSGTGWTGSSAGWRAAPTRCTCACCCRATGATSRARPAAGRG